MKGEILTLRKPDEDYWPYWVASYETSDNGEELPIYLHRRANGLIYAGTTAEPDKFDNIPTAAARQGILERASRMMPFIEDAELVEHLAGPRPNPADGITVLGGVPGWEGLFAAVDPARHPLQCLHGQDHRRPRLRPTSPHRHRKAEARQVHPTPNHPVRLPQTRRRQRNLTDSPVRLIPSRDPQYQDAKDSVLNFAQNSINSQLCNATDLPEDRSRHAPQCVGLLIVQPAAPYSRQSGGSPVIKPFELIYCNLSVFNRPSQALS